jgi:signal transduction histidine kinase
MLSSGGAREKGMGRVVTAVTPYLGIRTVVARLVSLSPVAVTSSPRSGTGYGDMTHVDATAQQQSPAHRFLPRGDTLPDTVWLRRHQFLVALLAAHAFVLPIFGIAMGYSFAHSIAEGAVVPLTLALAALVIPGPRKVCAGLVTFGLLSCSALLSHFSGGYIEAHFHFFIVIILIGLYEDWLPFGIALSFVIVHHGIGGSIDPSSIYNHPAAQAHPWRWAMIHGAAISIAGVFSIGAWKLNEELRAQRDALAQAQTRAEAAASRTRVVAAAAETRRRLERDLHDGTQQRLVSLGLAVRAAEANLPPDREDLRDELDRIAIGLGGAVEDLQEIARGIHPAILSEGGLGHALETLALRSAVPVELKVGSDRRLPAQVEVAGYYVVSEALTNAAKHAQASVVHVELNADDSILELAIRDDGVGGADLDRGSGLVGLGDRVEALGGGFEIASPPGRGTSLLVRIPIEGG